MDAKDYENVINEVKVGKQISIPFDRYSSDSSQTLWPLVGSILGPMKIQNISRALRITNIVLEYRYIRCYPHSQPW